MNIGLLRAWKPARVYIIAVVSTLAIAAPSAAPRAQPGITIEPMMTKGPAAAAVTIVEYSDYQ